MTVLEKSPLDLDNLGYGPSRRWEATIALGFSARPEKTVMSSMHFKGPMRVQRPFYPEGAPCHVYLLHPPGGMVSGDKLGIAIEVHENAHALLTTPSAGKVYRADSAQVSQSQTITIDVASQGICEWLPQENILFDGANAFLSTRISLHSTSLFVGWDMISFGRQAGNSPFQSGGLSQRFNISIDGKLCAIENFRLDPELELLSSPLGLGNFPHLGNLYFVGQGIESKIDILRSTLPDSSDSLFIAATHKPNMLIVRAFSHCAEQLRNTFYQIWGAMREPVLMVPPSYPRIWST
jgi:urease accessory protein